MNLTTFHPFDPPQVYVTATIPGRGHSSARNLWILEHTCRYGSPEVVREQEMERPRCNVPGPGRYGLRGWDFEQVCTVWTMKRNIMHEPGS